MCVCNNSKEKEAVHLRGSNMFSLEWLNVGHVGPYYQTRIRNGKGE